MTQTLQLQLTGTLTETYGTYFVVRCPNVPDYLQTHYLTGQQAHGARVGDRVRLVYRTGPLCGEWVVAEVLGPSEVSETSTSDVL